MAVKMIKSFNSTWNQNRGELTPELREEVLRKRQEFMAEKYPTIELREFLGDDGILLSSLIYTDESKTTPPEIIESGLQDISRAPGSPLCDCASCLLRRGLVAMMAELTEDLDKQAEAKEPASCPV